MRSPNLSAGAKVAWGLLASYAWDDAECWPGQELVAAEVPCDPKTLRGYITELREIGLVEVRRRGLGMTNVYRLHEPDVERLGQIARPQREDRPNREGVAPEQDQEQRPSTKKQENKTQRTTTPGNAREDLLFVEDGASMPAEAEALRILEGVPRAAGSPRPTLEAVEVVRDAFPDRDLVAVARELDYWARHGNGARRQIKSVMGTFRNFVRHADPRPASRSTGTPVTSGPSFNDRLITD